MSEYKYPIIEVFDSFQGEGRYLGTSVTFVRFAGCNLSCPWCDTKSQLNEGAKEYLSAKEIAERVHFSCIVFTGGEPTLQPLDEILDELENKFGGDCFFMIETNGTNKVSPRFNYVACSPKPQNNYEIDYSITAWSRLRETDYKYVVDDDLKLEDIHKSACGIVYLQPEAYTFKKSMEKIKRLVDELTNESDSVEVRVGIQAHKFWEVQ